MAEIRRAPEDFDDDDFDRLILEERKMEADLRKNFLAENDFLDRNVQYYKSLDFFQQTFSRVLELWTDVTKGEIPLSQIELVGLKNIVRDVIQSFVWILENKENVSSPFSSLEAEALDQFLFEFYDVPPHTFGSSLLNIDTERDQRIFCDYLRSVRDKKEGRSTLGEELRKDKKRKVKKSVNKVLGTSKTQKYSKVV